MSIEDTALPTRFGNTKGEELIVDRGRHRQDESGAGRPRDPATIIVGRTSAIKIEGVEGAIARAKAYAAAGVDAIFLVGVESRGAREGGARRGEEADHPRFRAGVDQARGFRRAGARVMLQGHQPVAAAVKALREVYEHLHKGGAPADLKDKLITAPDMEKLVSRRAYKKWKKDYLR